MTILPLNFANAQIIPPKQEGVSEINPQTGDVIWTAPLPENVEPYRCEVYSNRLVVAFYFPRLADAAEKEPGPPQTGVLFLNSTNGSKAEAFDTREFCDPDGAYGIPKLADGGRLDYTPNGDERREFDLPNGWRSYGAGHVHGYGDPGPLLFFDRALNLEWRMMLPEFSSRPTPWSNTVLYSTLKKMGRVRVGHLFGMKPGANTPAWEFTLPPDLPNADFYGGDVFETACLRTFSWCVGKSEIYLFGSGVFFALNPMTGETLWRHAISRDEPIQKFKRPQILQEASIVDGDNCCFLIQFGILARFEKTADR